MKINVKLNGLSHIQKQLKADRKNEIKALETAIKVEGYRLRKVMKKEIRSSAPGGQSFAPISMIARRLSKSTRPLRKLANAVRYQVTKSPFSMAVGFSGPQLSKSWRRIALSQQEGGTFPISASRRGYLASRGGSLGKRSAARKYFFLLKSTKNLTVPARPIVAPFWAAHEESAWGHIRGNYRRKLRGERI